MSDQQTETKVRQTGEVSTDQPQPPRPAAREVGLPQGESSELIDRLVAHGLDDEVTEAFEVLLERGLMLSNSDDIETWDLRQMARSYLHQLEARTPPRKSNLTQCNGVYGAVMLGRKRPVPQRVSPELKSKLQQVANHNIPLRAKRSEDGWMVEAVTKMQSEQHRIVSRGDEPEPENQSLIQKIFS